MCQLRSRTLSDLGVVVGQIFQDNDPYYGGTRVVTIVELLDGGYVRVRSNTGRRTVLRAQRLHSRSFTRRRDLDNLP